MKKVFIILCVLTFQSKAIAYPVVGPIADWASINLDIIKRAIKIGKEAEIKILEAQVADFKTMAGIYSDEQQLAVESASEDVRASKDAANEMAARMKLSPERCIAAGGHGSTAADAESKIAADIALSSRRVFYNRNAGSRNAPTLHTVSTTIKKYCDNTSAVCLAMGVTHPKTHVTRPGLDLSNADQRASSLSSDDNTQTADEHDAALDFTNRVMGGGAPQALSPSQAATPDGIAYEMKRGDYQAQTDIARSVFIEKIERQRGNTNNYSFLKSLNSGTEVVAKSLEIGGQPFHGNKISSEELARVMATMRADSPSWGAGLGEFTNTHPLYQEMAFELATQLKMQYQQYMFLRQKNVMQAQSLLSRLDSTYLPELKKMRAVAAANR